MPISEVARHFGMCTTLIKQVCRRMNIKRWPHRQIRKIDDCIHSLQVAMQNADTDAERQLFKGQINSLKIMRKSVVDDPSGPHVALGASAKGLKIGSDASDAKKNEKEKKKPQKPAKKDKSPAENLSAAPQAAQSSVLTNQAAEQIVHGLSTAVAILFANQAATKATATAYSGMTNGNSQLELLSQLYNDQAHAPVSNANNAQPNANNAQSIGEFLRMQNSSSQTPVTSTHATNARPLHIMRKIPTNLAPSFDMMTSLHATNARPLHIMRGIPTSSAPSFDMVNSLHDTLYHQKLQAHAQLRDVFNIREAQEFTGRAFTSPVDLAFNSSADNIGGDYAAAVANALTAEIALSQGLLPSFTSILQKVPNNSVATTPAHNSQNSMAVKQAQMQDVYNIRTAEESTGRVFISPVDEHYAAAVATALAAELAADLAAEIALSKGHLPSFTQFASAHLNSQNSMAEKLMMKNLVPTYTKTDWTPYSAHPPQLTAKFPIATFEAPYGVKAKPEPQQLTGEHLPSTCRIFFQLCGCAFGPIVGWGIHSFILTYSLSLSLSCLLLQDLRRVPVLFAHIGNKGIDVGKRNHRFKHLN
jgi:hypothetical protein